MLTLVVVLDAIVVVGVAVVTVGSIDVFDYILILSLAVMLQTLSLKIFADTSVVKVTAVTASAITGAFAVAVVVVVAVIDVTPITFAAIACSLDLKHVK